MTANTVIVLVCNRCEGETKVHHGECIPSFCHWCGGYLRYLEERVIVDEEDDDDFILGLA